MRERTRNPAMWLLPFLLLAAAALVSYGVRENFARIRAGVKDGGGGKRYLLLEVGRRPSLAFGFRNFLADVAWLGAVQTASPIKMERRDYDRLALLIDAVTDLDPRFVVPYLMGGLVLGDSPGHAQVALNLLGKGKRHHPEEWRIPFYMGYIRYFVLSDPVRGGMDLQDASRVPGSAGYLPLLAARMLSEGRSTDTALRFLEGMMRQETDPGRRELLERRARDVAVERDLQSLEAAIEAYKARFGSVPPGLGDLAGAGLIREVPKEPNGGEYILSPDGTVRSSVLARRLKVFRNR